jgi:nitrite reductase/ring-hydroxylating ferredoxin subunit
VLVANAAGHYYAIEDACPHSGRSLSKGRLDACSVVCPGHGWVIDLATGRVRTAAGRDRANTTYTVERHAGQIVIYDVPGEGSSSSG